MSKIDICAELHQNAVDFAYEANSQRAFADARDGLKPGQRACLWEMYIKGYLSNKPHVKSAKIDGGVAASWWPHGTTAIYETFARMSQPWINNLPEVDWHGANGNQIIGSAPAADRYTEARLSKSTEEGLMYGLKKNNVPMILNFSEDEEWPEVLPAIFPRLMVNGCQGIGYCVANVWLPHNLKEITDIVINYIKTNEIDYNNIYPDFPSGGVIINKNGLSNIYKTGRGSVVVRAKATIEKNNILITELPYQTYVEPVLEEIKELILSEEITGIKDIYNKCDKKRLLIEIECDGNPSIVLAKLFSATSLQKTYSANQYALVSKTPKLLNLKEYFDLYINHNLECIEKEYKYDLDKAKAREEILLGLVKALEDIDNIIELIKKSENAEKAKMALISKYEFTENQAKAILDMRLSKLAHLEKVELNKELEQLISDIKNYTEIISFKEKRIEIFISRLASFTNKYKNDRKSELTHIEVKKEDKEEILIEPEECVVITTKAGTIKRVPSSNFKTQKRNGKGVKTQEDITVSAIRTNTTDSLLMFTNKGNMYRLSVNDIPEGSNISKGQSIKALTTMELNEEVSVIHSVNKQAKDVYVMFITKNGMIKKTGLDEYIKTKKKTGIPAIKMKDNDSLASVFLINAEDVVILTQNGYGIKFNSLEVGETGRVSMGVKGIVLSEDDQVVCGLPIVNKGEKLGIFTKNGYGKKMNLEELPSQKRAGKGVKCTKAEHIGSATMLSNEDKVLVLGSQKSICISSADIPELGRVSTGNVIIKDSDIVSVSKV
jgi:DNA gyrase subunit A